jgi:hypothetical protein
MPVDQRFNLRDWLLRFSDTTNTNLRDVTNEVARKLLQELPGGDPGDITPPGEPTNLVALGGVESVALMWTAPPDLDVVRYRVQRSVVGGGVGFATITETLDVTLVDDGLTGGTTYFYRVAAIDDAGNVGDYSDEANATPTVSPGPGTAPTPPINLSVVNGDSEVTLFWAQSDITAVSTRVLRSDISGSGYAIVANGITGLSYADQGLTNGDDYFYVLQAVNGNGDVSTRSAEIEGEPVAPANPGPPTPGNFAAAQAYLALKLSWDLSVAGDLDHYLLEYGTSAGVYTVEVDIPYNDFFSLPFRLGGLESATTYYLRLTAVDTKGVESTPTAEISAATFDAGEPITPVAPATPTNFRVVAEGNQTVAFAWDPNTEDDLANYILAIYLGQGVPTSVGGSGWSSAAVIPAGINSRVLISPALVNEQTFYFYLLAQTTSGLVSPPTGVVTGTPTAQTGTGGGSTGGGTGATIGVINGDTGLGPYHKAPGATFDIALDFTFYTTQTNLFTAIGNQLQAIQNSSPAGFFNSKRVVVLLPFRDYRFQDNGVFGGYYECVGINAGTTIAEPMWYPYADDFQLHLVAPYPGNDINLPVALAKLEPYNFQFTSTTDTGFGWARGSSTQGIGQIAYFPQAARNRLGLWFIQHNAGNGSMVSGQAPLDVAKGGAALTMYAPRVVAPYHFINRDSVSGAGPGTNAQAYMPRWIVSIWRMKLDYLQHAYFDLPYLSEHMIYERNPPVGDVYYEDCTFRRAGGNVLQSTRRMPGSPQGDEGPDMTQGQFAGTHYFRRLLVENCGRSWWSSSYFEIKNAHRVIDFDDSNIIVNNNPGCADTWPPPNLATLMTDEFCDGPYTRNPGSGDGDTSLCGFITNTGENGAPPMPDGHQNAGVLIRDTHVFIREPQGHFFNILTSRYLDVEDSTFLSQEGTSTCVALVFFGSPVAGVAPNAIDFVSIDNNNTPALIAAFEAAHVDVVGPYVNLQAVYRLPPPFEFGGLRSGGEVVFGDMDDTIYETNIQ